MRYYLNFIYKSNLPQNYNATNKARTDVSRTFCEMGIRPFDVYLRGIDARYIRRISRFVMGFFPLLWSLRKIKKGDFFYVQYPEEEYMLWLTLIGVKLRGGKVFCLIHDIKSLRGDKLFVKNEYKILKMADVMYVHTEAMQEALRKNGVKASMKIMNVFDYYTQDDYRQIPMAWKYVIIFAGNLEKSLFVKEIPSLGICTKLKFNLYGLKPSYELGNSYQGVFNPEKTSVIGGGWGLVWDGDSSTTCSSRFGYYLRYNSSHKISLYLAAGIPVIVWECSALSSWVKENNVGITIQSLYEIEKSIDSITDVEYMDIINSVLRISGKLRNGDFLKSLLAND